jgi:hypothetical protein
LAAAFGSTVTIDKVTRCSNIDAELADHLSKGDFAKFFQDWPADRARALEPAWIPPAILAWIDSPAADPNLGDKILRQISAADGGI